MSGRKRTRKKRDVEPVEDGEEFIPDPVLADLPPGCKNFEKGCNCKECVEREAVAEALQVVRETREATLFSQLNKAREMRKARAALVGGPR